MTSLTDTAIDAVTDSQFEGRAGYCQKFVRQVVESVYGKTMYSGMMKPSARESGIAARDMGLTVPVNSKLMPGDILYKLYGSGGYGHVGIYVNDNMIVENSSTRIGRVSGAKGYRTLGQFGKYDIIVRLEQKPRVWAPSSFETDLRAVYQHTLATGDSEALRLLNRFRQRLTDIGVAP